MDDRRQPHPGAGHDAPAVTVVGGGPVGAVLALELGRRGVPTLLLDERVTIEQRPKAQLANARSMEHFRHLGLADEIRARAPLPASWSMSVVFTESLTGRELHRLDVPGAAALRRFPLGAEPPQRVPQYVVEEVLRAALAACPLIECRFGVHVTDVAQDDDQVVATWRDERGVDRTVRSRWLVGADGARSTVRERLGIALDGTPGPVAQLGIFFRSAALASLHDKGPAVFYFVVGGSQPGLLGPVDATDRWWFQVAGLDPTTDVATLDPSAMLRAAVGRDFPHEVTALVPWRWGLFLARRFRDGRVWLAGDAVHQHLYDRLGPWFTLLDLAGEPGTTDTLRAAFDAADVPLAVVRVDDATLRGQCAADLVLVRPDQHVAWRGTTLERARAASVCATVAGHASR